MNHTGRMRRLHEQWARFRDALRQARHRSPRITTLVIAAFVTVAVLSIAGPLWYLRSLRSDLPTKAAITRIGEMDQATAVYDRHDQLAFTIFKEQRIDVAARGDVAQPRFTRFSRSKISGSTSTTGSTPSASCRRRSANVRHGAPRRAAARSRSSSRGRAFSRPTRPSGGSCRS